MSPAAIPTLTFEAAFGEEIKDVAGNTINDVAGNAILDLGMEDIVGDVRSVEGITVRQGIFGSGPEHRVADYGSIEAVLKNVDNRYNPDHASVRARFAKGLAVKVGVSYGGNTNYTRGTLRRIKVDPGQFGRRGTEVTAYDWLLEASRKHPEQLAVQFDQRDDQLLQTLLDSMPNQPLATSFATGPDTYAYAFHNFDDESAYALGIMQAIADSGLGYIFIRSDASYGEELVYQSRITRLENDTAVATIDNMMDDVEVLRDELKQVRKVRVFVNPVRVDAAANTTLYSHPRVETFAPGETKTFFAYYVDPSGAGRRVAGYDLSIDYTFSSVSGSGDDLHSDLDFGTGPDFGGNSAVIVATNNAASVAYLNTMDLDGRGVYLYEQASRVAENADLAVGRELDYVMPYNNSLDHAQDIANVLLEWWGSDEASVTGVSFNAVKDENTMAALTLGNIGAVVEVIEDKTNLDGIFYVQGREFTIKARGRDIPVQLALISAQFAQFLKLDSATNAQLGSSAILAV